jgi:hypothetical protein
MARYICLYPDARHSPIHDCESTFWLLVWSIAFAAIVNAENNLRLHGELKESIIKYLQPDPWTLKKSAECKKHLLLVFDKGDPDDIPAPFRPFIPLLKDLAILVHHYNNMSTTNHALGVSFSPDEVRYCIFAYIRVLVKNPIAETSWEYLMPPTERDAAPVVQDLRASDQAAIVQIAGPPPAEQPPLLPLVDRSTQAEI